MATPIIMSDNKDFSLFYNETNVNQMDQEWPAKNLNFEEYHDSEKRFAKAFIPKEEASENMLKIRSRAIPGRFQNHETNQS